MSSTLTRAERSALTATARRIRTAGQRQHHSVTEIVNAIRATVPLHPLEAHRLAYGWSRRQVVEAVAEVYRAEDRGLPGLTESMLCRWEHDGVQPDPDYAHALGIVFAVRPRELSLTETASRPPSGMQRRGAAIPEPSSARCYARPASSPRDTGGIMSEPSSSSLTAVRESLALALSTNPDDADAHEQLDGAVQHYDRTYSHHPPAVLTGEITATRRLIAAQLNNDGGHDRTHVLAVCGWLSGLLGNLAFHQGDNGAATAHLATALRLGTDAGERRLQAWTRGAQAMLAGAQLRWQRALDLARDGYELAATPMQQVQLLAWAQLTAQAHLGQHREAERTLHRAETHLDLAELRDGRFGFDNAEFHLHVAGSAAALGNAARAREHAELSAAEKTPYGPGWVAARLTRAATDPDEAATISFDVLNQINPAQLRSTSRRRLHTVHQLLVDAEHPQATELHERLRALPPT